MRALCWIIFVCAFILGALASLKVEVPQFVDKAQLASLEVAHTPAWDFYILAMFLGIGSLVILKMQDRVNEPVRQESDDTDEGFDEDHSPVRLLTKINETLAGLDKDETHLATIEAVQKICLELSYQRQAYMRAHGLAGFASFFEPFSHGERYLNRSWSTLIDRCPEESLKSLNRARNYFQKALDAARGDA